MGCWWSKCDGPSKKETTASTTQSEAPTVQLEEPKKLEIGQPTSSSLSFEEECLREHNRLRAIHGVPPLKLDQKMCQFAKEWARTIASQKTMQHRPNNKYGENIYWGSGKTIDGKVPVKSWYDEIKDYDFSSGGFSKKTGHFTQVVWKASTKLGVGFEKIGAEIWVVANYDPPGNYRGQYQGNVPLPTYEGCHGSKCLEKSEQKTATSKTQGEPPTVQLEEPKKLEIGQPTSSALSFEEECLREHNRLRAMHGVPPLKLDREMCQYAKKWARTIANQKTMQHRPNNEYGENIYWASGKTIDGKDPVNSWYGEIKNYNFRTSEFSPGVAQFTQVVWKRSAKLGVGFKKIGAETWVVANYDPPGNYIGEFQENVLRPINEGGPGSKHGEQSKIVKAASTTQSEAPPLQLEDPKKLQIEQPTSSSLSFEEECLREHNRLRAIHGVPPLKLDQKMCQFAKEWARTIANQKSMQHRPHNKYGENIYWALAKTIDGKVPVKSWYDEIRAYNFSSGGFSGFTGHFTQVVWKTSARLGVGFERIGAEIWVVANYDPPGNYSGQYQENVPPPRNESPPRSKGFKQSEHKTAAPTARSEASIVQLEEPKKLEIGQPTPSSLSFEEECLREHNRLRAIHGVPPLTLDREMCQFAKEWARTIASRKIMQHRPNNKYGENIYWGSGKTIDGKVPVKSWYDEIKGYNYSNAGHTKGKGHFTQVVWKTSARLGVGFERIGAEIWVVANYDPPGNYGGQFQENVPPPGNESSPGTKYGERSEIKKAASTTQSQAPPVQLEKPKKPVTELPAPSSLSFEEECLREHNRVRAIHGVPPLKLDREMSHFAKEWARTIASKKTMELRPNNKYGENVFWASGKAIDGKDPVKSWYEEIKNYNFSTGEFSNKTGRFTQVVWKASAKLGVGFEKIGSETWVVADYDPPGNYNGQFQENVPRPINEGSPGTKYGERSEIKKAASTTQSQAPPVQLEKPKKPVTELPAPSSLSFEEECLREHNRVRAIHGVPPLKLDREMSHFAKEWARTIASKKTMELRPNNKYGENIFWASGKAIDGKDPVKSWYDEIKNYNFSTGGFSNNTGRFTQVVWKTSTKLGVGFEKIGSETWVVADYDPPGNYTGQFQENVPRPINEGSPRSNDFKQTEQETAASTSRSEAPIVQLEEPKKLEIEQPTSSSLSFEEECLREHNRLRAIHGVPPLKLDRDMCQFAKEWARIIASQKDMQHRPNNKYGENIYWAMGKTVDGKVPAKSWYDEIKDYNFSSGGFSEITGHFTQLVWKTSVKLGVGFERIGAEIWVVANYDPRGNYIGQFQENVPPPRL